MKQISWLVVVFCILLGVGSIFFPRSLTFANLTGVFYHAGVLGIIAIGQTLVIMAGGTERDIGLDLSVGPIVFFTIMLAAELAEVFSGVLLMIACITFGAFVGLLNGLIITRLRVPPFIATLGMGVILTSTVVVRAGGGFAKTVDPFLVGIASGRVAGVIPIATLIWGTLVIAAFFIVHYTRYGRMLHAVSGNIRAAKVAGIPADNVIISTYVISGMTALLGGLIYLGYAKAPSLRFMDVFTMESIMAVLLGGTAFSTGYGTVIGTAIGSFFVPYLGSFLVIMGIKIPGRSIASGLIVLIMVTIYMGRKPRMDRIRMKNWFVRRAYRFRKEEEDERAESAQQQDLL